MDTIVTITIVDECSSPRPTQSKLITGDKILVRVGENFVVIPLCERMPSFIKCGFQFFKLQQEKDGTFKYEKSGRRPRGNARVVEAEELWEKPKDKKEREKLSKAREAIGTLVTLLLKPK